MWQSVSDIVDVERELGLCWQVVVLSWHKNDFKFVTDWLACTRLFTRGLGWFWPCHPMHSLWELVVSYVFVLLLIREYVHSSMTHTSDEWKKCYDMSLKTTYITLYSTPWLRFVGPCSGQEEFSFSCGVFYLWGAFVVEHPIVAPRPKSFKWSCLGEGAKSYISWQTS